MKIVKLETFTKPYVSFVKITVEDGSIGYGQMSTYHANITAQIFHKQVAPWVLGKEYFDFDDLEDFIFEREHKFCLLYTSPSPRDPSISRMPSSA